VIIPAGQGRPNRRADVRIRAACPRDAASIARVHVNSWRDTYAGIIPAGYLAGLSYEKQTREWLGHLARPGNATFVAESGTRGVIGFANGGPERTGQNNRFFSEMYVLYLLRDYQRRGIGGDLMTAFAGEVVKIGLRSMLVWVLSENPSRAFYPALGGELVGEKQVGVGGAKLTEVAYGWRDVRMLLQLD
jgi:L-amino acid N-acyltransferase YncA